MSVATPAAEPRQVRRAERYKRRAVLARAGAWAADRAGSWEAVPWARTAGCGLIVTGDCVEIHVRQGDDGATAYPVGVSTCSSVWLCPVCSAKIRTRRALDVRVAAALHVKRGGRLVMMTLTVRHGPEHALAALMDTEADAWRSLQRDARWRELRKELAGQIRSWEITHGLSEVGGSWHPHFHVLLFVMPGAMPHVPGVEDRRLRDGSHEGWYFELGWIADAWANRVEARLGARPDSHGFHVMELDASAAEYVSKIADETARADLKSGSRSVYGIVDALEAGESWAVRAWHEYATATKGRRAIQWSRGLRDYFGLGVEKSDEEIVVDDDAGGTCVEIVEKRKWGRLVRSEYGQTPPIVRVLEHWESVHTRQLAVNQS